MVGDDDDVAVVGSGAGVEAKVAIIAAKIIILPVVKCATILSAYQVRVRSGSVFNTGIFIDRSE